MTTAQAILLDILFTPKEQGNSERVSCTFMWSCGIYLATYISFGKLVDIIQKAGCSVINKHLGNVLVGHAAQDLLLGSQPNVPGFETFRHNCRQ
jgi:hypothetical protein